jgi:hypothetical protein
MTFEDVLLYCYRNLAPTDKRPSRELVMSLANTALDLIDVKESSWYNNESLLGENSMNIPEDCVEILRVTFDSVELEYKTQYELDNDNSDWRTSSGTPDYYTLDETNIILNTLIGVTTVGVLKVFGKAKLPHFPNVVGEVNPLIYLPTRYHLAPGDYVLANLPFNPDDKLQLARFQKHQSKWENAASGVAYAGKLRKTQPFSF